jgi:hypothetical protein
LDWPDAGAALAGGQRDNSSVHHHLALDIDAILGEKWRVEREIKFDGGEISILKALGLSGSPMAGKMLLERVGEMEVAELADSLKGLITLGYVLSTKVNLQTEDDINRAAFRVNPSYSRDLRDALRPGGRRRDERQRRRHRD